MLGSRISQISLALLILAETHSPARANTVAALNGLPYLLFGLLAGMLIDRWDRKRTMRTCLTFVIRTHYSGSCQDRLVEW